MQKNKRKSSFIFTRKNNMDLFSHLPEDKVTLLRQLEVKRKTVRNKWILWMLLVPVSFVVGYAFTEFFALFDTATTNYAGIGFFPGFGLLIGGAIWLSVRFPTEDEVNDLYRKNVLPL